MMLQKLGFSLFIVLVSFSLYANDLPIDVQQFIEKRTICDHFRGEYPDPEGWGEAYQDRLDEVNRAIENYCLGTDKVLAKLKEKYKMDSDVINILNTFETDIGL